MQRPAARAGDEAADTKKNNIIISLVYCKDSTEA